MLKRMNFVDELLTVNVLLVEMSPYYSMHKVCVLVFLTYKTVARVY